MLRKSSDHPQNNLFFPIGLLLITLLIIVGFFSLLVAQQNRLQLSKLEEINTLMNLMTHLDLKFQQKNTLISDFMSTPVQLKLDDYKLAHTEYLALEQQIQQLIDNFQQKGLNDAFAFTQLKNQVHDELFLTEVIPSMNANQRKNAELGIIKMARIVVDISDNNQRMHGLLSEKQKLLKVEYEEGLQNLFWILGLFVAFALVIAIFITSTLKYRKLLKNKTDELTAVLKTLTERERNKALVNLVSGVSHELNTPLGNAVLSISYIRENTAHYEKMFREHSLKSADLADFFQTLNDNIDYIDHSLHNTTTLINSFKRVVSSSTDEQLETVNIYELIDDLISVCKFENLIQQHTIAVDCPTDLLWHTYPESLSQVLVHLINNSIRHAFKAKEGGHMHITTFMHKENLIIEYADTGTGMSAETLDRIFDPFFTTSRGSNAGLGLSIVFNIIVERLMGSITCSSVLGEGTIFRIELSPAIRTQGYKGVDTR